MTACPSCLRSVPDEALSCPACGAAMIASATPTRHQPAIEPAYPAASPALNADVQVKRLTSPGVRSDGRFVAGAMLAGGYRIVGLLGKGGMGEVYKAEDLKLNQTVALKFLPEAKEIDPLAERVILRCLEKDPKSRPASAAQVALALPSSDPLQAALVLGETPSPEMVAAAGEKTGLRPAVAVACLAAVIFGLLLYALVASKAVWQKQALHENSPDTLAHRARGSGGRISFVPDSLS